MQANQWLDLENNVCVVTGAGSGIGREVCLEFARAGAQVVAVDRSQEGSAETADLITESGGEAIAVMCDVGDRESVAAAANKALKEFGRCDVLVNNAGLLKPAPLEQVSVADWDLALKVNLTGALLCSQEFGRDMLARRSGSIVHTASIGGSQPQPLNGAYSPSKSALIMLSRQLAAEWGPRGVRSNVVSPGLVRTGMSERFYQIPGVIEARAAVLPIGRIATPRDIANVIVFLSSSRSNYVTGAEIVVDGGLGQSLMNHVPRPSQGQ